MPARVAGQIGARASSCATRRRETSGLHDEARGNGPPQQRDQPCLAIESRTTGRDTIEQSILLIRGHKVMLDRDLAALYRVPTKVFNQAVKRHKNRFPPDFMFRLSGAELRDWRSQIVTSNPAAKMGLRRAPYVFTEHGILMLSSVLNSERAVQVNIEIMRAFVRLRQMLASHRDLARRLDELEGRYDSQFRVVFDAIRKLMSPRVRPGPKIGFRP